MNDLPAHRFATQRTAPLRPAPQRTAALRNAASTERNTIMRLAFEQSAETRKLVELFLKFKLGERVTYAAISRRVGFTVTPQNSAGARRVAERDHDLYICVERKVGFVRGDGREMTKSCVQMIDSVRRKSRRIGTRAELALSTNLERDDHLLASELLTRSRILVSTSSDVRVSTNKRKGKPGERAEKFDTTAAIADIR